MVAWQKGRLTYKTRSIKNQKVFSRTGEGEGPEDDQDPSLPGVTAVEWKWQYSSLCV